MANKVSGVWSCGHMGTWLGQGLNPNPIPKVFVSTAALIDLWPTLDPILLLLWEPSLVQTLLIESNTSKERADEIQRREI